jgi:LysR family transcriptional regulator, cys regulon transcriptional activator
MGYGNLPSRSLPFKPLMNLQQLRYLCGVVDAKFSVSRAAEALHTSQPGISKQIQMLERELGVEVLVRQGNRITGLTAPGEEIHAVARRMLWDARNLKHIGEEYSKKGKGRLTVATTHIHARYLLRPFIREIAQKYVDVSLELRQGDPGQIAKWVLSGEADLGFGATSSEQHENLAFLPCGKLERSVFTLAGHPLLKERALTLEAIAHYPIIMLDTSFAGGRAVIEAFAGAGIRPNIVMTATDADVIKAYVEIGQGIAILPSIAHDPERDPNLRSIEASHIFPPSTVYIVVQKGKYLRSYMHDFISMINPKWDRLAADKVLYNEKS